MARGRRPTPCPISADELRELAARESRVTVLTRRFGVNTRIINRWLDDAGVVRKRIVQRKRGVPPAFMRIARRPDGTRIWVRLYSVWGAMRTRCQTPGDKDYVRYGARGIRVCDAWQDYNVFRAWAIENGYRQGLTLERHDNDGDYEPDNCSWITKGEQQGNIRRAITLTLNGVTNSLYAWARIRGIPTDMLRNRLYAGWSDEHALTIPIGGHRPKREPIPAVSSESGGVER